MEATSRRSPHSSAPCAPTGHHRPTETEVPQTLIMEFSVPQHRDLKVELHVNRLVESFQIISYRLRTKSSICICLSHLVAINQNHQPDSFTTQSAAHLRLSTLHGFVDAAPAAQASTLTVEAEPILGAFSGKSG